MRNRYVIAGLVLALTLSVGTMLSAQTSSSATQSVPQSSTGAPAGATSGAAGGTQTTTPQDQSSPGAAPGAQTATPQDRGTAGAQPGQPGHPATVEDELQLTADQKAKLQPIIQDEMSQINSVRSDTTLSMEQKQAKVQQIKQTSFPKIQAVLTPEQQKKLSDLQQRARQQQGGDQSNQSNTQQSPKQ